MIHIIKNLCNLFVIVVVVAMIMIVFLFDKLHAKYTFRMQFVNKSDSSLIPLTDYRRNDETVFSFTNVNILSN